MTVGQLITQLQKFPNSMQACLVYDSQVMCVSIKHVGNWNAEIDDEPDVVVGLFDKEPARDDKRRLGDYPKTKK